MSGAIPSLPQYASMAWCSVKAQGQLYIYLYLYGPNKQRKNPHPAVEDSPRELGKSHPASSEDEAVVPLDSFRSVGLELVL
jgi:hypothetical protein